MPQDYNNKVRKPIVGNHVPITKQPILGNKIKDQINWSFSFIFFNQIDNFGLAESPTKWFISVLEKLREMGKEDINEFFKDHRKKNNARYHQIKWDAINIPVQRNDLTWLPKAYLENEDDYPFFQFQVSTGLGRIIGFWKEDYTIFYIVLLDPKHNMQPSKKHEYKVDHTNILPSEYTSLLCDLDELQGLICGDQNCKCRQKILTLPTKINRANMVYFPVDENYYQQFLEATNGKSLKDIIELGLLQY